MLFKSLSLKNFKCFEEVEVEFAPITLLTGANSSGKSSLIYSILAMLQTEQFPFYLSPNGKYVDLGSFEEMVNASTKSHFQISLSSVDKSNSIIDYKTDWINNPQNNIPQLNFIYGDISNWVFEIKISEQKNSYIFNSYLLASSNEASLIRFRSDYSIERYNPFVINKENYIIIHENELHSLTDLVKFIENSDFYLNGVINDYRETQNESFNYIGSFRLPPERTYYQKAKAQDKVGTNGEGYLDQIIEWEESDPAKFEELNRILADLELIESIKSDKMKGGRFELTVRTKKNSTSAALTDVGFGISQFLPVIVADLQLPDTSCLALSQPEIHLHPKIQALFGNYLANQINKSQKQYIVETHSEYLLNRIRLLLVKGELKPEDVQVYYFENDGLKSIVHRVEFTTDGQIKGAPEGFFDTYGMDVMDIALNA